MPDLYQISIIANAAIFLWFLSASFASTRTSYVFVYIWAVLLIISQYVLAISAGGTDPRYRLLSLDVPVFYLAAIPPILFWLLRSDARGRWIRLLNGYVLVVLVSTTRPFTAGLAFAAVGATVVQEYVYQLDYTIVLLLCAVTSLVALRAGTQSLWRDWFAIRFDALAEHRAGIIIATLTAAALQVIPNVVLKGFVIRVAPGLTLGAFSLVVITNVIYFILVDHVVCFGLTRRILRNLFPGDMSWVPEVALCAALYGVQHYYLQPVFIGRDVLLGALYGYLYHRTDSLLPGILLNSLLTTVGT